MKNRYRYTCFIIFFAILSSAALAQTPVTWTDLVGVEVQADNSLLKTAGWGDNNGGAVSHETLPAGVDGWVELTVYATNYERYAGLTESSTDQSNNIDYAFKITSTNTLVVSEKGENKKGIGDFEDGDVLRIERIGTTIYYKHKGGIVHTSTTPSVTPLIVDVSLYHSGGAINNVNLLFGSQPETPPIAPGNLSVTGEAGRNVLTWEDNATTEAGYTIERKVNSGSYETLADIAPGTTYVDGEITPGTTYTYRVKAYNASGDSGYSNEVQVTTPTAPAPVGTPVTWTALTGVEVQEDNSIIKTAGWGGDNGGAVSEEILPAGVDGWIEFTASATSHERYIGLTETSTDATNNIDYAFKLSSINTLVVSEQGQNKAGIGDFADGDLLRIERTGTTITYKQNGTVVYTSSTPSATPLTADVSLYHFEAVIKEVRVSFTNPLGAVATDFDRVYLEWDTLPGLGYEIHRSEQATGGFTPVATVAGGEYHDHNLAPNTTYYYRLIATDGHESVLYARTSVQTLAPVATESTLSHQPLYNGNITAIKWKAHGDSHEQLYTYHYDAASRLTKAEYASGTSATGTWDNKQGGFSVPHIAYDLNGNILSLNRQAYEGGMRTIDALQYSYSNGNQLQSIEDQAGWKGFANKHTGSEAGPDYSYDANGNMTKDRNKGIDTVEYNHLNLPVRIGKSDGRYIQYLYDAAGVKYAREEYDAGGTLVKKTEYIGELIYETDARGNRRLAMVHHEEGRVIKDEVTGEFEYQYHLRDHLGNTRLTFTTKPKTIDFPARFESETAEGEEKLYGGIDSARVKFPSADAAHSDINVTGDDEVIGLNNQISAGAALSIPVGPGDKLDMQVYSYYETGDYSSLQPANAVLMAVAGAFGGASGGNAYEQSTYNAFSNADGAGMLVNGNDAGDGRPAAYLNYILFDEHMGPYKHGHAQIEGTANSHGLTVLNDVVVDKAGFAYIYLSN
ncbi:fibronectin type III domain-containing protein, partial [Fulvivirga kasyanovii]